MTEERWLPIAGFPGYEASSLGRIRSYWVRDGRRRGGGIRLWREEPMEVGGYVWPHGYLFVALYREGRRPKWRAIHPLILETFVGPRPDGHDACHINGNPADNRLANLRWGSKAENQHDTLRHGRHKQAKLNPAAVRLIWGRLVAGASTRETAREFGVSDSTISQIKAGRSWSHVTRDLPGWPLNPCKDRREPVYPAPEFLSSASEVWLPIPGSPGFCASTFGRIMSYWVYARSKGKGAREIGTTGRIIPTRPNRDGHLTCSVRTDGRSGPVFVHKLILLTFAGPRPPGMVGRHIDGNHGNNRADNLCWDTRSANARDRFRHGVGRQAKLDAGRVAEIRRRLEAGESIRSVAEAFGIGPTVVGYIKSGRIWSYV